MVVVSEANKSMTILFVLIEELLKALTGSIFSVRKVHGWWFLMAGIAFAQVEYVLKMTHGSDPIRALLPFALHVFTGVTMMYGYEKNQLKQVVFANILIHLGYNLIILAA